jgi:glycosyltransferase involved in cell wall biosynthesis
VKALHVIPALASRYGGPSAAAIGMSVALQRRGVDSLIVCTDADGPGRLPVRTEVETEFEGARVVFFNRSRNESLKVSLRLSLWLRRNIRSFDIVHIHSVFSHPSLAAGRACRRQSVPYVVRPLGHLDRWSLRQHAYRKRLFLALGGERMLKGAAAIHWTARAERRAAAEEFGALPGFVLPLAVDEIAFQHVGGSLFRNGVPWLGQARYVLFLSRLHPKKNLDTLIAAFADSSAGSHRLVIVGDGEKDYVAKLQEYAGRVAPGRVHFTGWLDGPMKYSAFEGADLFVLPSFQENFGLVAAEAMASGVPVIVTAGVNLADDVRETGAGWVADPSRESLTAALREALSSEGELQTRGRAGRIRAETRFRWSAVATSLEREYESLLSKKVPGGSLLRGP